MIHFHRTSLMTSPAQTVVNTVNTVGVMGKGLAAAFKDRYPEMFVEYRSVCDAEGLKPGGLWLWKGGNQWVLNFATKKHWRNPSKIEYVRDGLMSFRENYDRMGIREVAFPRLGCGNGGLKWADVKPLMLKLLYDLPITIYIHDFEKNLEKPEHEQLFARFLRRPDSFDGFCEDISRAIKERNGEIQPLLIRGKFYVTLNEKCELRGINGCSKLLATEEDLFRIWSTLVTRAVSKVDLPEDVQLSALKIFSVIAQLPYVRPVNIADKYGRNVLALEYLRNTAAEFSTH